MPRWTAADIPDQSGRTALVTGANSGLGLHTSLELARRGARVLMACRSAARGQEALARVRREVPNAAAELLSLDLASLAAVRAAVGEVTERTDRLDLLVNNAGVMAIPRRETADGFETQFGTNHLGHFALTGLLLPALLSAGAPRVVVVSSSAHRQGRINLADLNSTHGYARWGAYAQSKLANLLFAGELSRRATGRLLLASAHPGYAATNLQTGQGSLLLESFMKVGNLLIAQSDAQGAWPSLYAATMPDVQPDEYFGPALFEVRGHPKRVDRTAAAKDQSTAELLWAASIELTGVTYRELEAG